jgi:hypothetical protein
MSLKSFSMQQPFPNDVYHLLNDGFTSSRELIAFFSVIVPIGNHTWAVLSRSPPIGDNSVFCHHCRPIGHIIRLLAVKPPIHKHSALRLITRTDSRTLATFPCYRYTIVPINPSKHPHVVSALSKAIIVPHFEAPAFSQ